MKVELIFIFIKNFFEFDWIIFALAILNMYFYLKVKKNTDRLYYHYNSSDRLSNLPEKTLEKIKKNTKSKEKLTAEDLLNVREKMNKAYAGFSNFTTMFPLFGMFGTVWAMIPMVNVSGMTESSNFFSALTSTAWGIVAAIIFKALDSTVSYKIEDNEKHTEYLIFKEY